jgi:hypothetical protein
MTYQPSGSKSTNSARTIVREQYKWYFEVRGNLQPACTIFYEPLIGQLIIWKYTDLDIILLGDFNENIYSEQMQNALHYQTSC